MPFPPDSPPPAAQLLAIVWQRGRWRCEYWKPPESHGLLKLYFGDALAIDRPVRSIDDMRAVAAWWRELIADPDARRARLALERRGTVRERRRFPRGGRRAEDTARAVD